MYICVFVVGSIIAWGAWVTREFALSEKQIEHLMTVQNSVVASVNASENRLRALEQIVAQDRAWGDKLSSIDKELHERTSQMTEIMAMIRDQENRCAVSEGMARSRIK